MHLKTQNVNTGFRDLVFMFSQNNLPGSFSLGGENAKFLGPGLNLRGTSVVSEPSRNGNVLRIAEPVTITYSRPTERVLFNTARDANPFGLLYEALWMLAGRNDVAPLAYYTKRFREFSDDGETLNGAYGYRWRRYTRQYLAFSPDNIDQLNVLVSHLKAQPNSRRAVLQMWNVEDDLLKIGKGPCPISYPHQPHDYCDGTPNTSSKDVCCNLSVLFSLRKKERTDEPEYYLDMTVTNRSNDLIWGALGANYVTFTILQEYMAARLGAEVGVYNQFSNNMHVYDWNWKPQEWLAYYGSEGEVEYVPGCNIVPLVKDPAVFEKELPDFVETHKTGKQRMVFWREPFLNYVVDPMMSAFHFHKDGDYARALEFCEKIKADDWRVAATAWIERRAARANRG